MHTRAKSCVQERVRCGHDECRSCHPCHPVEEDVDHKLCQDSLCCAFASGLPELEKLHLEVVGAAAAIAIWIAAGNAGTVVCQD